MKQWTLNIVFAMSLILAGYALGVYMTSHRSVTVAHAQAAQSTTQAQPTQATTQVNVPKAWGPLVGTMNGVLVFQDRAGTIRLVAADTGAVGEVITRN